MRPPAIVLVSLVCAGLTISNVSVLAQDLSGGRARLIEGNQVDVNQLVQRAGLIVHGSVVSKESRWLGRVIYTHYELLVRDTLKGPVRSSVLAAVPGGAIGNVQLMVPGAPDLAVGDQLVFFGLPLNAGGVFTPVGTFDGIVPVRQPQGNSAPTVSPRGKPENLAAFLEDVRVLSKQP